MTANINLQQLALFKSSNIRSNLNDLVKDKETDKLAGFLQNGKFAWLAVDGILRVISVDTGLEIAYYNFAKHYGSEGCFINHVEDINYLRKFCLLAVSIEFTNSSARAGMVCIISVQGCKLLGSMDMSERITCCKYISSDACRRSVLRQFHGTLAIGTDQGKLFLVDLMIPDDIKEIMLSPSYDSEIFPMINVPADLDQIQISHHHRKVISSRENGERTFFSIQLNQVLEETGSIISMLCMPNLYMVAVGLNDGRMILYDLIDLQAFHLAYPPGNRAPLTHMSYIEPADDPRSAVYVWTFHSSKDGAIAVMHSIMFDNKENGFYENFRSCSVRLTLPIFNKDTFPICCRSITKQLTQDEEDILTLNLLAWTSPTKNCTHVMIFDLNQWYKEEMPNLGDWRNPLSYIVVFELHNLSLDVILDEKSLLPFNSIKRPEEHFYPNSLSFDIVLLEIEKFSHYRWSGLQNLVLQRFNTIGPQMILEPGYYFSELIQVAITPQFYDVNFNIATSLELKREFLLSVALEYNFTGFLRKCACAWADGSYLGKDGEVGVGLSTLTEWIWNRVRAIKEICNSLCTPLFDYSEQRIDYGTQKQLSMCCKQLKILSDLLQMIGKDYQKFIPENVQSQIQTQANTVKMASDYQEVLQWLLNVGLLPEGHCSNTREENEENEFVIVPYPYRTIFSHYESQRSKLYDETDDKEKPSKYLFIDSFIENECCNYELLEWGCLYPPKSIQSLLRSLLVPDIPIENKYVIFIYVFMDITNALSESSYASIVRNLIKFPAVFKMNPAVIKRTQAFWNLDNGQLETAVEELISPLLHDRYLPQWQRELLIGALLKQNSNSLALRVLRCPGNPICSELEVSTLLANNLISEALKIQRASGEKILLEKMFHKILHSTNYEQLLDLALSENEGKVLQDYLQHSDLSNCVNLHFVYLLQRSKFIDAAQLMDSFNKSTNIKLEPPKQMLNAYYSAMNPITRKLTSMVYSENPNYSKEVPSPFSVNLIKSRCNASNDIFKKCVQSITEANYDSLQDIREMPFIGTPKLGIFEYRQPTVQMQEVSYPLDINDHGKRQNDNNNGIFRLDDFEGPKLKRQRLEEIIESKKYKSYAEKRISLLTNFRNRRPKLNFTSRTPITSTRTTPERIAIFGDLLTTPVVEKRTPQKLISDRATTPASILKTRSCRSSISPTNSRFSEFDDNKSVKSITFAALPGTNESSLQDSSYLDESFGGEHNQIESSGEFYSPDKSPRMGLIVPLVSTVTSRSSDIQVISSNSTIAIGPKPRPPIKSRSTTPNEQTLPTQNSANENIPIMQEVIVKENHGSVVLKPNEESEKIGAQETKIQSETQIGEVMIKAAEITAQSTGIGDDKIADTVVMNETDLSLTDMESFHRKSVLKSDYDDEESEQDSSEPDDSIFQYVRKSVLPDSFSELKNNSSSSSDEDSEQDEIVLKSSGGSEDIDSIAEDEHFEEEELPEHSDYDEVENEGSEEDSYEYGNVELDDSGDESLNSDTNVAKQQTAESEIIEIPDSDEDDVQIESVPATLPPMKAFATQQAVEDVQVIEESSDQERRELLELATVEMNEEYKPESKEEQMIGILYDDIQEANQLESTLNNIDESESNNVKAKVVENLEKNTDGEILMIEKRNQSLNEDLNTDCNLMNQAECSGTKFIESEVTTNTELAEEQKTNELQIVAVSNLVNEQKNDINVQDIVFSDKKEHKDENLYQIEDEKPENLTIVTEEEGSKIPNVSEMSESCSFTSAQNELNEAVIESLNNTLMDASGKLEDKASYEIALLHENEESNVEKNVNAIAEVTIESISENQELNPQEIAYFDINVDDTADTEKMETAENISEALDSESVNPLEIGHLETTTVDTIDPEKMEVTKNILGNPESVPLENPRLEKNLEDETGTEKEKTENSSLDDKTESDLNILEVARLENTQEILNEENTQENSQSIQDQNNKEIEKIMTAREKNTSPEPMQHSPVDLSTPKRRSNRVKSSEIENLKSITPRKKRAVSEIPSSGTSSPISRSSRASSEHRHNPKVLLKEKLLERIEESPSGILTRNKSRMLQEQSRETTPVSRAPSEEIDSVQKTPRRRRSTATPTGTPTTPRRISTRTASKDSFKEDTLVASSQVEEKSPVETKRKGRGKKKTSVASDDEHDDVKSTKSSTSTSSKKKDPPSSSSKISPVSSSSPRTPSNQEDDELSVRNRRLTRSQLSVLEKSRQLAEKISASTARLCATKSNHEDDSDNESIKSDSTISRRGRKRKIPERFVKDMDTSSVTSKSSRKSKSSNKKHLLSMIQEEGDSEVSQKFLIEKDRIVKK